MPRLKSDASPIHYEIADLTPPWIEAPETILFHHGVGTTAEIWSDWLPALIGRYRIIRFDLPGFGRSSLPADYEWTLDGLVDDLFAVADAADCTRFHLVGESAGGTVALHAAATRSERLLTVTGVSCSHKGASLDRVREWWDKIEIEGLAAWSAEMMDLRFYPGAIPETVYRWFESAQTASAPEAVLGLARMLIGADLTDALGRIALPVLLLAPDASPFVSTRVTAEMQALIPGAEMRVFAHARHGLACSDGGACAETLYDFLDRTS